MDKLQWIKDLVLSEQQMEESGVVDLGGEFNSEKTLETETIEFLKDVKCAFIESAAAFNQMKSSNLGSIKIYGIAKTKADFMLFRNGYKLIFAKKASGQIGIRFHHVGSHFVPGSASEISDPADEATLMAQWGAFGDLFWSYQSHKINLDSLVRYYLSRFVKDSSK